MIDRPRAGFTLLELLVAVVITIILAALMLSVVTGTLTLWHRTQDRFSTSVQAALVFDLLERDLQAAICRRDSAAWMGLDVTPDATSLSNHGWLIAGVMKPASASSQRVLPDAGDGQAPSLAEARFGLSGAWLRFITTNGEADGSLPVAVSYQIARRPLSGSVASSNPASIRYALFRSAVSTAGSLSVGNDVLAVGYRSNSVAPAAARNPRTLMNPNNADALATNVVDFGLWFYVRDGVTGRLRRIFPADRADLAHVVRETSATPDENKFPDVADVMLRVLHEEGASLLAEIEAGGITPIRPAAYATDAEWWWGVVEKNSTVFVRRIELKGTAP